MNPIFELTGIVELNALGGRFFDRARLETHVFINDWLRSRRTALQFYGQETLFQPAQKLVFKRQIRKWPNEMT